MKKISTESAIGGAILTLNKKQDWMHANDFPMELLQLPYIETRVVCRIDPDFEVIVEADGDDFIVQPQRKRLVSKSEKKLAKTIFNSLFL